MVRQIRQPGSKVTRHTRPSRACVDNQRQSHYNGPRERDRSWCCFLDAAVRNYKEHRLIHYIGPVFHILNQVEKMGAVMDARLLIVGSDDI